MRDVAERAGVNIATVHYYYASKEGLIRASYAELQSRFRATVPSEGTAAERLDAHLHQVRDLLLEDDALRAVLSEIALRARRSEELRVQISLVEDAWFDQLRTLFTDGLADGSWVVPVDPDASAALLISLCKGACLPVLATARRAELVSAFDQVLGWLTRPAAG